MEACQVCGAAGIDAGGYCTGCGQVRDTRSYAVAHPAVYAEAVYGEAAYGEAVYGEAVYAEAGYPAAGSYPVSPAAPLYPAHPVSPAYAEPVPPQPGPGRSHLGPLFLLTAMVVVLVIGAVSVVLIKTNDRGAAPSAAHSPPSTAAVSASPSAVVDRCVVGDWSVTSALVKYEGVELSTTAGGIFHLRADGTGTWDFGSGITLTGTIEGKKSEDLVTGRVDFTYRTAGQSFTFRDVRNDVREVVSQGRNDPVNRKAEFNFGAAEYTCAGDATRLKFGAWDVQMGRK